MAAISSLQIGGVTYDIYAKSAKAAPVASHTISSHSDSANFFSGNSARSACSATSAKNAGTATYATSAGAAPVASHNHNYKLSGAGSALDISAGINLKPNGNIAISTAANTINISAKDTTYTSLNGINSTEYQALTSTSANSRNPNAHQLSSHTNFSTYFNGTSANTALTAKYAVSAGAAPVASHDHAYKLSGNGTAVNVSAGVNFKPSGSNIKFYVSGNDIYISAKNDNSTAYIPSGFQVSAINGTTTGVYYLSALKLNAGTNIGFTSASNSQITITAKDTTYTTANFITATHLSNIQTASGYAADWNTNKAGLTNSAKSGWSAWSAVTANSSTWSTNTDTKVSQTVTSDNVFYPILTKDSNGTTTVTAGARFADVVTVNPSTKMVRANKFGITSSATMEYNTATNSIDFIFN